MKTKEIKIGTEKRQCVLVAGGPNFKIYTAADVKGWIIQIGKRTVVVTPYSSEFVTVSRYATLKYQNESDKALIKEKFNAILKGLN